MQERKERVGGCSGHHNTLGVLPLVGHKSILGPLIPVIWTSDEVSFAFQSQSGQPFIFYLNFSWTCRMIKMKDMVFK